MKPAHLAAFVLTFAVAAPAPALADTFEIIPFTYNPSLGGVQASRVEGISRDGGLIVGSVCRLGGMGCGALRPVHWNSSLETFPLQHGEGADELALAVSDSGLVTVGSTSGVIPTRWLGGPLPGGTLERFLEPPAGAGGIARDVSADGLVVVGDTGIYTPEFNFLARGFVRVNGGPAEMLAPAAGFPHSRAYAVSADGLTIVGASYGEPDPVTSRRPGVACAWSTMQPAGAPIALSLPPGAYYAEAADISSDASFIAGTVLSFDALAGTETISAVRWAASSPSSQPLILDPACGGCYARAISGDGSAIVGTLDRGGTFLWTQDDGLVDLGENLAAQGVELNDWLLTEVSGIADDATTIIGNAFKLVCPSPIGDCTRFYGAYRVHLGEACPADTDGSGVVDATDLFIFLDRWFSENGQSGENLAADFDRSGTVDATDIFAYLDAWFAQPGPC